MAQSRQLAAIMFTDIVGYTALMGKDEQKAFTILNENRELQKPIVEQYNGKWIKELGDGVMMSFITVSDAVNAAVKIQEACDAAKDFQLRIGIHLGEVVFENDDVFGDGVNIASRIQSAAKPGSIYISESVHHNVSNKKEINTRFVGEEQLKNVKEPIKIFEVIIKDVNLDRATKNPLTTVPQNSIAVLPFANMSSDPEQEYFSDGITEEIITDLSHLHDMLVISRSSVMTFKNSGKKIKDIAAELNVHYVLEGSVRKAGNNLRITAQLIDAGTDAHIWAEKYNGTVDDVFDIQEKVSRSIVDALKLKLTTKENKQISERRIDNVHAYDCYLRARRELNKWNEASFDKAKKHIENALDIMGSNPVLFGAMGYVYWNYANLGIDPAINYQKAEEYANKSFALDPGSTAAHLVLANIKISGKGQILDGLKHLNIMLAKNPNDFDPLMWSALVYMMLGKLSNAQPIPAKLMALDPLNPISHAMPGLLDFYSGNFESAITPFQKAYNMEPENPFYQVFLPLTFFYNSQPDAAIEFIEQNLDPNGKGMIQESALMIKPAILKQKDVLLNWIPGIRYNAEKDGQYSHFIAAFCAMAELKDDAFYWLENAINKQFWNYPFLANHETAFKELRNDERYLKLLVQAKNKWESVS
jgi:adenylate cyclase